MKITDEIKSKIFAQYPHVEVRVNNSTKGKLLGVIFDNIPAFLIEKDADLRDVEYFQDHPECKLILKPRTNLSDDDALQVSALLGGASHLSKESQIFQAKELICTNNFYKQQTNVKGANWLKVFQFLISKGYDLPNALLDDNTLEEMGLAVYEPYEFNPLKGLKQIENDTH